MSTVQAEARRLSEAALSGDITTLQACRELHDLLPELGLASNDEARLAIIAVVSVSDHVPRDELGPIDDLPSYELFNRRHGPLERNARQLMSRAFSALVDRFAAESACSAGPTARTSEIMRATQHDDED